LCHFSIVRLSSLPFRGKLLFVAPYFHEVLESEKMDRARN
jgi:hypothetical protein